MLLNNYLYNLHGEIVVDPHKFEVLICNNLLTTIAYPPSPHFIPASFESLILHINCIASFLCKKNQIAQNCNPIISHITLPNSDYNRINLWGHKDRTQIHYHSILIIVSYFIGSIYKKGQTLHQCPMSYAIVTSKTYFFGSYPSSTCH